MSLLEQLLGANDGAVVEQVGRRFALEPAQAASAIDALLPMVAAGFQRRASSEAGLGDVIGALAGGGTAKYVENLSQLGQPSAIEDGNTILGHIFESKDVSREVAARASASTGIGADILKAMLPIVASMVVGAMARGTASDRPTVGAPTTAGPGGGLLDMLTPMLDSNRDGAVFDDLAVMMTRYMTGR